MPVVFIHYFQRQMAHKPNITRDFGCNDLMEERKMTIRKAKEKDITKNYRVIRTGVADSCRHKT